MASPGPPTGERGYASTRVTGAAHDLRNVLFVITSTCERLLDETCPGDPQREELELILSAAARGAGLAADLVSDARGDGTPQAIDPATVVNGMKPLLTRLAGPRVVVEIRSTPDSWPVAMNAVQLEQVVMNLAVNARDAMPAGGRLTIAIGHRTVPVAGGEQAHFVVIEVADTGAGIDPAVQDRVFEPFFTTKGTAGTGVGLATVRALALLHGGFVELVSAPGAGTTMRVVLPRSTFGGA